MAICVFLHDVSMSHLPDRVKQLARTVTCLRWPYGDRAAQKLFWAQLHKAIIDGAEINEKYSISSVV